MAIKRFQLLVYAAHEAVKMHPHLGLKRQRVKKQVHQVGLAAPHPAPEVKPALWRTPGCAPT